MVMITCAALLATATPAYADAPEFLLGELGVRLDLPAGTWRMTRWSDWDFKGEAQDGALLLFAWPTPIQTPITEPEGWAAVYEAKIEELQGIDPKITRTRVETIGGRRVAFVDATFGIGKAAGRGVMYGATLEIAGHDLNIAVVGPERLARAGDSERRAIVERLEVRTEPTDVVFGGPITAANVETTLPADFRAPLPAESEALSEVVSRLPIRDLHGCFTAIRPVAGGDPDILVACSERGVSLGVVDEHSFASVDENVRGRTFGAKAEVPPAEQLPLEDRTALLYAPRDGLALGVAGHDQGVARFWALGRPGADLSGAVRTAMRSATFSGQHPVTFSQQAGYWLRHRPMSPVVVVPALLCVLLAVGIAWVIATFALRPRKPRALPEDTL